MVVKCQLMLNIRNDTCFSLSCRISPHPSDRKHTNSWYLQFSSLYTNNVRMLNEVFYLFILPIWEVTVRLHTKTRAAFEACPSISPLSRPKPPGDTSNVPVIFKQNPIKKPLPAPSTRSLPFGGNDIKGLRREIRRKRSHFPDWWVRPETLLGRMQMENLLKILLLREEDPLFSSLRDS